MTQQQIDLETVDMAELERLANEELQQPRDEQGRFVQQTAPSTEREQVEETEQPDEVVYRRVIDLHDGSGVQVFEAPTLEELVEKLGTAQEHATRKIRELSTPKPAPVAETIDENEEFVLSQQFLQSPTKAFRELFKRTTGQTIEEFKSQSAKTVELTRSQAEFNAGQEFQRMHPDFNPTVKNATKIQKWLKNEGLDGTVENIEKAFADLNESGLLEARPDTQDAGSPSQGTAQPRIAAPQPRVVGQRRVASGLSSQRSQAAPRSQELTEEQLYEMPYEKLIALAQAEEKRQR